MTVDGESTTKETELPAVDPEALRAEVREKYMNSRRSRQEH